MTDKELRRLNRGELLEMLIRLTGENDEPRQKLGETEKKLDDRSVMINESGSIAEAALRLNDVFAAAENAAKLYRENSERLCDEKTASAEEYAGKTRREADDYSEKVREDADSYSFSVRREADETAVKVREDADAYSVKIRAEADRYLEDSRDKAGDYWDNVIAKATVLLSDHNALAEAVKAEDPEGGNEQQQQ